MRYKIQEKSYDIQKIMYARVCAYIIILGLTRLILQLLLAL